MNIHIRAYIEMKFKMKQNFVKSSIKLFINLKQGTLEINQE